jgi:hypothetical protein
MTERVDYYTQMKRIARTDPLHRIILLSLKCPSKEKEGDPLLPLLTPFDSSPLHNMLTPDDDESEKAASFLGPGPWSFHHDLRLPESCSQLHFTNRNRMSNISVTHILKIVMRVERGDDQFVDPKTGKRKLFDIVLQTPVHILSVSMPVLSATVYVRFLSNLRQQCRCSPEWTALPHYLENFAGDPTDAQSCPCVRKRKALLGGDPDFNSNRAADPGRPAPPRRDSLLERNTQFERLISGQESELGEAPPSYDSANANR